MSKGEWCLLGVFVGFILMLSINGMAVKKCESNLDKGQHCQIEAVVIQERRE